MRYSLLDLPRKGQVALGVYISDTNTAIAEIAVYAGYDFMRIDYEHTLSDPSQLCALIRAADAGQVPTLVRISSSSDITKLLDFGASGILVPDVETREQAQEAVNCCKYAPIGRRGMGSKTRCIRYGFDSFNEYLETANNYVSVAVQIESKQGVDNIDEILSVSGVDIVAVGRYDLSQSMGIPGKTNDPVVVEAEEYVIKKALEHGVYPLLNTSSPSHLKTLINNGVLCATVCVDFSVITKSFKERLSSFREESVKGAK